MFRRLDGRGAGLAFLWLLLRLHPNRTRPLSTRYALHELRNSVYLFWRLVAVIFQYNNAWSYIVLFFSLVINAVVLVEYEYKDGVAGDEYVGWIAGGSGAGLTTANHGCHRP